MKKLDRFINQYVSTALWSSVDDKGIPLDEKYNVSDISEETLSEMINDCEKFKNECPLDISHLDETNIAHDFWLTRNHHGAGFWDGDYSKEFGEKLTNFAQSFKEVDLYIGDDGKIYQE